MKIHIHPYQLPWSSRFSRTHSGEGALMGVIQDGVMGFADLHPWPSLGDAPLDQQITLLKAGRPTPQTQRTLAMAQKEALARATGTMGIQFRPTIKNHHLFLERTLTLDGIRHRLGSRASSTEFLVAKWKLAPETAEAATLLLNESAHHFPQIHWRLDANALFTFEAIIAFWAGLSAEAKQRIQFIEDPCVYHFEKWNRLEEMGMPLAIDFETRRWQESPHEASPTLSGKTIFVYKPAVQDMTLWAAWLKVHPHRFLVTSYLDHPVGLLHAQWVAESLASEFPELLQVCGLNLPVGSDELKTFWPGLHFDEQANPAWSGVAAQGIGFSQTLENLKWIDLGNI